MPALPITSLCAGIFAVLLVVLSLPVSLRRAQLSAVFGDKEDDVLRRRIRAHGNFIEYAPLAIIAIGLLEFGGASFTLTATLGGVLVAARILHALGMLYTSGPAVRAVAMVSQHISFLIAGVWLIRAGARVFF